MRVSKAVRGATLGLAMGVTLLLPLVGNADDKDVVDYRQHAPHVSGEVIGAESLEIGLLELTDDASARSVSNREQSDHVVLDSIQLGLTRSLLLQAVDDLEDAAVQAVEGGCELADLGGREEGCVCEDGHGFWLL